MGRAADEPTLLKLAYAFEQGTLFRQLPASTPPLGHASIPELGTNAALIAFALGAVLLWQKRQEDYSR